MRSIRFIAAVICTSLLLSLPLAGCKEEPPPPPKIDLDQVNEAFLQNTGATWTDWLGNFEMKVNEIYPKDDFVSVGAERPSYGRLVLRGYVERNNQPGYQRGADESIFRIVQDNSYSTGFRYALYSGSGYHHATHVYARPAGANPLYMAATLATFAFVVYYTPATRFTVIRTYRTSYRRSPAYATRQSRSASYAKATSSKRAAARSSRAAARSGGRSSGASRGGK